MNNLIENVLQQRKNRTYSDLQKVLIQEGGYLSPDEVLWEDILTSVALKKPVLLKGPSGSGKTKLAQSISGFFQQPMHSINCSVDLDAESLLGFKTIIREDDEMAIEFIEGPVVQAMKQGHILYIDEINMAKPETLPILHSVLDHRRMLTNPFTGEVIEAHPDFSAIAAINIGYIGTSPMNEALKNRFVSYRIPYISGEPLKNLFEQAFPEMKKEQIEVILRIGEDITKQVMNGLLAEEAASIRSLLDAAELSHYMPVLRAVRYAIAEKLDDPMEQELLVELAATWVK